MKILVAGDFCPRGRVASAFEKDDYASILSDVRNYTENVDYSIVNLECPIVEKELRPIEKIGPNHKCSKKGLNALKFAGFNCVTLANNHFRDFGNDGVFETLSSLDEQGIEFVGGGMNFKEASLPLYKRIAGSSLAVINCCEQEFNIASDNSGGSNPLNPIQQYYDIKRAKTISDYVIVIVHGGQEHWQLPSPRMVETYRFFIDAGADAVVNHHQHCYSGYEVYKEKPIFYGLGNFSFDNPYRRSGIWTEGYMVSIDFAHQMTSFELHPYKQCAVKPNIEFIAKESFNKQIDKINSIISNPIALQEEFNKYCSSNANRYSNIFEPVQNRFYLALKRRGLIRSLVKKSRKLSAYDYIICESHREKLIHWLKNDMK